VLNHKKNIAGLEKIQVSLEKPAGKFNTGVSGKTVYLNQENVYVWGSKSFTIQQPPQNSLVMSNV
jgi:hypothetical protein